jgi:diphthamide biosynthesis methyltransferase
MLEEDALKVAKVHAARHRMTLGEAVSELVRQAADRALVTESRNGLQLVRLSRRSPKVTASLVDKLSEALGAG